MPGFLVSVLLMAAAPVAARVDRFAVTAELRAVAADTEVRALYSTAGPLTSPSAADPVTIARSFLLVHGDLVGLDRELVLALTAERVIGGAGGPRRVVFTQSVDGVPANVHTTSDKRRLAPESIGEEPVAATADETRRATLAGAVPGPLIEYYVVFERDPTTGRSRL